MRRNGQPDVRVGPALNSVSAPRSCKGARINDTVYLISPNHGVYDFRLDIITAVPVLDFVCAIERLSRETPGVLRYSAVGVERYARAQPQRRKAQGCGGKDFGERGHG